MRVQINLNQRVLDESPDEEEVLEGKSLHRLQQVTHSARRSRCYSVKYI